MDEKTGAERGSKVMYQNGDFNPQCLAPESLILATTLHSIVKCCMVDKD